MPIVLSLKRTHSIPIEVASVQLEILRTQTLDEIKGTIVQFGNTRPSLGELFDVTGTANADNEILWQGDCSNIKLIGAGMKSGRVTIEGDAGMHLGAQMKGGEIVVRGNAGDWLGAEMQGGRICVHGSAGHLAGAGYRGARKGMTGGEILIHGDAGHELGQAMRRGLIAVGGNLGDAAGFGMLAGSILVCGEAGVRHGAGMKRGTIAFLGTSPAPLMLPTFKLATIDYPVFLRVYLLYLQRLGFRLPEGCVDASYRRYSGDFLESGKGEILVRQAV